MARPLARTGLQDQLPKNNMAPESEDAHLSQGGEDVNITDFVQDRNVSSIDFKLPKVDIAAQPEDARLLQGDEDDEPRGIRCRTRNHLPQGDEDIRGGNAMPQPPLAGHRVMNPGAPGVIPGIISHRVMKTSGEVMRCRNHH